MFLDKDYLSQGVEENIPWEVSLRLWQMFEDIPVEHKDNLQRFELRKTDKGQYIRHTQEEPPYQQEITMQTEKLGVEAVDAVIYIICSGGRNTMMLAEELPFCN